MGAQQNTTDQGKMRRRRIINTITLGVSAAALVVLLVVVLLPGDGDPPTQPFSSAVVDVGDYPMGLPETETPEKPNLPRRRGLDSTYVLAEDGSGEEVSKEPCFDEASCLLAPYEIEVGTTVWITATMWTNEPADGEDAMAGVAVQYPDGTRDQTTVVVNGDSHPVTVRFPFDTSKYIPDFIQEQDGEVVLARYVVWAWLFDENQIYRDKWRKLAFKALAPTDSSTGGKYRVWNKPDPRTTLEGWANLDQ